MRFLHVRAPHMGLSKDLKLGIELVLDIGGCVSLQGGFFMLSSTPPFARQVTFVSDPASGEVPRQEAVGTRARWLLAQE